MFSPIGQDPPAVYSDNFFYFVTMDLVIDKELVFFDLETTGLSITKDRIIQICMVKFFPAQPGSNITPDPVVKTRLINPGPEGIALMKQPNTAPHNIKWEDLLKQPTLKNISKQMRAFLGEADLAGHNIRRFDIPFLREEFLRIGISDWPGPNVRILDTLSMFSRLVPRNLAGAVRFFTNKEMNHNAHDAEYDVRMNIEVLEGMMKWSPDLGHTTEELHQFAKPDLDSVDWAGHFVVDSKSDIVFARGNNKGARIVDHPGYCKWMLANSFPEDTKIAITETFRMYKRNLT